MSHSESWIVTCDYAPKICVCEYIYCISVDFLKATGELLEVIVLKEDSEGFLTLCSLVFKMNVVTKCCT